VNDGKTRSNRLKEGMPNQENVVGDLISVTLSVAATERPVAASSGLAPRPTCGSRTRRPLHRPDFTQR
jgi:hypothetical protein